VFESEIIQEIEYFQDLALWLRRLRRVFTSIGDHGISDLLFNGAFPSAPYRGRFDASAYECQTEFHDNVKCFAGCAKAHPMVFPKGLSSSRRKLKT
jgi:hypothetical protein